MLGQWLAPRGSHGMWLKFLQPHTGMQAGCKGRSGVGERKINTTFSPFDKLHSSRQELGSEGPLSAGARVGKDDQVGSSPHVFLAGSASASLSLSLPMCTMGPGTPASLVRSNVRCCTWKCSRAMRPQILGLLLLTSQWVFYGLFIQWPLGIGIFHQI